MEPYQPKVVLLTGVAGFIASNLGIYLVKTYPEIHILGLDMITYCSNMKNLDEIKDAPNFTFIKGDFTDNDQMNALFEQYHPDTVIHMGAYSHVSLSYKDSVLFTVNNIGGTHILLEQARQHPVKRFIMVSTDECYGSRDTISTEETILQPTNVYSATKACSEILAKAYHYSFNVPVIITRGNNVFGRHCYPEKVIPRYILRLSKNLKCQIQGSGNQKRSFLYVDDVCRAFEKILFQGEIGHVYNIGAPAEQSVLDVATSLIQKLKPGEKVEDWIEFVEDRHFNDARYFIDSSKLHKLGWKPQISFNEGLDRTVEWYLSHLNHWDNAESALSI